MDAAVDYKLAVTCDMSTSRQHDFHIHIRMHKKRLKRQLHLIMMTDRLVTPAGVRTSLMASEALHL